MIGAARAQTAGPASGASTSGLGGAEGGAGAEGGGAAASPAPADVAAASGASRPTPDAPAPGDPGAGDAAAGVDYYALWIEHGPGWWPLVGLILLVIWLWRRPALLEGLTEFSGFGVQLKRDVGRVDQETASLGEEIAALRAEQAAMRAALAEARREIGEASARPSRSASASAATTGAATTGAATTGAATAGAATAGKVALRLFARDGDVPLETRVADIGDQDFVIGRGEDCDWRIDDPSRLLSRRHLALSRGDGGLTLRDLSANGTFLRPEAAPVGAGGEATLGDRGRLWLGAYRLEVDASDAAGDPFAEALAAGADGLMSTPAVDALKSGGAGVSRPPPPSPAHGARPEPAPAPAPQPAPAPSRGDDCAASVAARVDAMLADPRFEWRSVARLAYAAGMDPEAMALWLAERTDRYRLGRSGAGEPLARLRTPPP